MDKTDLTGFGTVIGCLVLLIFPFLCNSAQWINPKDLIKDPMLARLQQGRTELTELEKKEIAEYGFTGLELLTYADANTRPGKTWDKFERAIVVTPSGQMKIYKWLWKEKYCYKDFVSLLMYDGIKPGDILKKYAGIHLLPPKRKYRGWVSYIYLTSFEKHLKDKESWTWIHELRRYRRSATTTKADHWLGSVITYDDLILRRPWEDEHKIIGKDFYKGHECIVVESKNINSDYYLAKRVTWVEHTNFLNLHEEQFNCKGTLILIIDKSWEQIKPWNYWVISQWNCVDPASQKRLVRQNYDWIFDQGFKDGDFLPAAMGKEHIWKQPQNSPPPITHLADLPAKPQVRLKFWNK